MLKQWEGFKEGTWMNEIDVRNFIQQNYTIYNGDKNFLAGITDKTKKIWDECGKLILEETKKGILDVDTETVSGVDAFAPGYIDRENEVIVGLQTDAPLKRITNPWGGIRMAEQSLESYGYKISDKMHDIFTNYRKTHNQGVFDAYTEEIRAAR
jgi:formate C-acetyltransferase